VTPPLILPLLPSRAPGTGEDHGWTGTPRSGQDGRSYGGRDRCGLAPRTGAGLVLRPGPGDGHGADHGPASPIGPLHWATLGFPACGLGMDQSLAGTRTGQVATLTVLRCPVGTSNREFSAG